MDGTDRLLICGQALNHCVNYTVRDIVNNWPKDETSKIVILKDCASSAPGFEDAGELFLSDMKNAGLKVGTSDALFRVSLATWIFPALSCAAAYAFYNVSTSV
jgi:nicotinamidase-related amidase